jgi:hypothetical protein
MNTILRFHYFLYARLRHITAPETTNMLIIDFALRACKNRSWCCSAQYSSEHHHYQQKETFLESHLDQEQNNWKFHLFLYFPARRLISGSPERFEKGIWEK